MQDTNHTKALASLFRKLLVERGFSADMAEMDKTKHIMELLLKRHSFEFLWDAIYFSQEDTFWNTVILNIAAFAKHSDKLILKGQTHRCPRPDIVVTPAKLPTKSLLEMYRERRQCQSA